jgi:hypothetical protein
MGVVDGRPLEPQGGEQLPLRIVLKFREGVALPRGTIRASSRNDAEWRELSRELGDLVLTPYVPSLDAPPVAAAAGRRDSEARRRLAAYYVVDVPPSTDPVELVRRLSRASDVEIAYREPPPVPPPVYAVDDPRNLKQGYLDAAPNGINARWAWSYGDGSGVQFVDIEQGWTLNHEDLAAAGITIISGSNTAWHGHGTAVLGQVVAVDNTLGGVGIAPGATARVVSQFRPGGSYNTADAIVSATAAMSAGGVLLLEAQTSHPNAASYVPVEVYPAEFDAIRDAVDAGIIVVEAAGNGSVDLDTFTDFSGKFVLRRGHADFKDSGAILVGAGQSPGSPPARSRSSFSCYGSRVDCFGWGDSIDTCGNGTTGTSTTAYTSSFGGTSGASPIVAGAALILQSWARKWKVTYSPETMRGLLSDAGLNTASFNPPADRIGVMPDLYNVVRSEESRLKQPFTRWVLVAFILFGVSQDGGGVIFVPGRGPVPIDPWGPLIDMSRVSPGVRDAMASLAIHELAGLIEDEEAQRAMKRVALSSVKRAADKLMIAAVGGR